jgi:hypothetical protein
MSEITIKSLVDEEEFIPVKTFEEAEPIVDPYRENEAIFTTKRLMLRYAKEHQLPWFEYMNDDSLQDLFAWIQKNNKDA